MTYPWIERQRVFLHNWTEVDLFILAVLEEAKEIFGEKSESDETTDA